VDGPHLRPAGAGRWFAPVTRRPDGPAASGKRPADARDPGLPGGYAARGKCHHLASEASRFSFQLTHAEGEAGGKSKKGKYVERLENPREQIDQSIVTGQFVSQFQRSDELFAVFCNFL
jgi:hypothetical protein